MEKSTEKNASGRKSLFLFLIVGALFVLGGCTHALEITNLADYYAAPAAPLKQPVRIGVTSSGDASLQNGRYITAVVEAFKKNSNVAQVVYPYKQIENKDAIDAVVDISITPTYSAKGSNFLVTFPGFIIFAPTIWGFGYNADVNTVVNVTKLKDNSTQQLSIPCKYDFRQAEIGRTWTEGVGWVTWVVPLVGGIVFTSYDPDATNDFITEVSPFYGPYVANKIISYLQNGGTGTGGQAERHDSAQLKQN